MTSEESKNPYSWQKPALKGARMTVGHQVSLVVGVAADAEVTFVAIDGKTPDSEDAIFWVSDNSPESIEGLIIWLQSALSSAHS